MGSSRGFFTRVLHGRSHGGASRRFSGGASRGFSGSCVRGLVMAMLAATWGGPAMAAQDRTNDAQQQPPIQARPGGPETSPRTDQTVDVVKGTRLVLGNNAGEVVVRSWDREQVRVQATHNERVTIDVASADSTLRIRTRAERGPAGLIDFQLTVPRWMAVNLSGTYLESTIEGTTAEVTVESVHGNIRVVGGSGNINLRSVQGIITVDKASGNVRATTINEGIRLTDVSGDVYAETTNGDIEVQNAQTSSLEISTVNGDVTFNGTMRDAGSYRLTTHGGDIRLGLGGVNNATVFVRTFQGDFMADFPIQLPDGQSAREGSKRFNFTLGSGSARIELQTFNGDITLARKSIMTADQMRRQRRGETPKAPPAPAPKPPKGDYAFNFEWDHPIEFDFPMPMPMPTPAPMLMPSELDADVHFDWHVPHPPAPHAPTPPTPMLAPPPPLPIAPGFAPRPPGQ
jgi:DUF4097 and DUF4098 domain-containing protein YvlB